MKTVNEVPYEEFRDMEAKAKKVDEMAIALSKIKDGRVVVLRYEHTYHFDIPKVIVYDDSLKYIEEDYRELREKFNKMIEALQDKVKFEEVKSLFIKKK